MKHGLSLFLILAVVWALLSGMTAPLIVSLGALSCLFVVFLITRMNLLDRDWPSFDINWLRLPGFTVWLCKEILLSNISVARAIIGSGPAIKPKRFVVDASSLSELGQVIYANSITLTPGTVSLFLRDGKIEVHSLLEEAAIGLQSGDMKRQIERLTVRQRSVPGNNSRGN